jgi:hypothetical protein
MNVRLMPRRARKFLPRLRGRVGRGAVTLLQSCRLRAPSGSLRSPPPPQAGEA